MHYSGYLVVVKDAQKSRQFYEDVFGAQVFLDLGGYVVFQDKYALISEADWQDLLAGNEKDVQYRNHSGELFFEEDNLDVFINHLESLPGIEMFHGMREYPWGQRVVRFYDPDGHVLEVGDSMKVVVKKMLGSGMSIDEVHKKALFPLSFIEECSSELAASSRALTDAEAVEKFVRSKEVAFLSGVDTEGFPTTAVMSLRNRNGIRSFDFSTQTSTNKVETFRKNPQACLYVTDDKTFSRLLIQGRVDVSDDPALKAALWQDGDEAYFPQGQTDPGYVVLRFRAERARFYEDESGRDIELYDNPLQDS